MARKYRFEAFRSDPFLQLFRVWGYHLADVPMNFALRLYPGAPGLPLYSTGKTTVRGAPGLRVAAQGLSDGLPWSDVELIVPKASVEALPQPAEAGAALSIAYDLQWSLPDPGGDYVTVEETILFGDFVVKGSVND